MTRVLQCSGAVLLAAMVGAGPAARPAPALEPRRDGPTLLAFDRFLTVSGPICLHRPAAECIEVGWAFADADGDDRLSLYEARLVRDAFADWLEVNAADLGTQERSLSTLGLWLVDTVGLERLHGGYDADGDGLLDRAELLADVRLDERPLGEILLDPEAVDMEAVAERVGGLLPLLRDRLP